MNLLTKAAAWAGELRAAYDAPLLKSLGGLDYGANPGRLLGTGGATWLGLGPDAAVSGYANHGTAYSVISYILAACQPIPWAAYKLDGADNKATPQPKHPLAQLLYRPNPRMSWADYKTALEGGLHLHGEAFARAVRPDFGTFSGGKTGELWPIPGPCMQPLPLGQPLGLFQQPEGWRYTDPVTGQWVDLPAADVLHIKYWNPTNPHRGLSPVQAGVDALTAAKAGLVSRVQQYQNQGPPYVLFDEKATAPWTPEQSGNVRRWFNSFRRGGTKFGELPITGGKLGSVALGMSPVDLDVLAAIGPDKDAVADLFHFPGQLLNGAKGTTFANMSEARKALYTNCVQPAETLVRDAHNRWLGPEYGDGVYLDYDLSGVPELQEDKKTLADWLSTAWWVPVAEKQRLLGVAVDWPKDAPRWLAPMTYGDPLAEAPAAGADTPLPTGEDAN